VSGRGAVHVVWLRTSRTTGTTTSPPSLRTSRRLRYAIRYPAKTISSNCVHRSGLHLMVTFTYTRCVLSFVPRNPAFSLKPLPHRNADIAWVIGLRFLGSVPISNDLVRRLLGYGACQSVNSLTSRPCHSAVPSPDGTPFFSHLGR